MDRPFLWLPTKPKHGRYCKSLKNRLAEHLDAQLAGLLTPAGRKHFGGELVDFFRKVPKMRVEH